MLFLPEQRHACVFSAILHIQCPLATQFATICPGTALVGIVAEFSFGTGAEIRDAEAERPQRAERYVLFTANFGPSSLTSRVSRHQLQ